MTKVSMNSSCGNAPKKEFLRDVNIAFAEGNVAFIKASVADDIIWNMIGDKCIKGKSEFSAVLHDMKATKTEELIINSIITHGKEGAVNGEMLLENGEKFAFCDVYEFSSAKRDSLKKITSYVIEIE